MSLHDQDRSHIVVNSGRVLVLGEYFELLSTEQFNCLGLDRSHSVQLVSNSCCWVSFTSANDERYKWESIRAMLGKVGDTVFQQLSEAVQLERWYHDHQFCGRCGKPTVLCTNGDRSRICEPCELTVFPRISPCVIGLVTRDSDFLLARGVRHPEGMFSTLAGFIEPGESAEHAFAREVYEEVGVKVANIRYIESQAWPFPGQLMLGFEAEYHSGQIRVQEDEIIEAQWFNKDYLPQIPPSSTISGRLIRRFIASC